MCRREMSLTGSTSFGFAQNTQDDFQNTALNSFDKCHKTCKHVSLFREEVPPTNRVNKVILYSVQSRNSITYINPSPHNPNF